MSGFDSFLSTPATGPTYTELAREVDRLKEEVQQARRDAADVVAKCRHGEIRQQAFLELAHELAEMEPAARDAAIRRIIDNAQ